jgi:DnaK suppressor protein
MNAERLAYFRECLESLTEEIKAYLTSSKESAGVVELDTSIGRLSRMDLMQNQQMAMELRRRKKNQLLQITNALTRIDQEIYGQCGLCRQPIAEDRLEAFPEIVTCVNCA